MHKEREHSHVDSLRMVICVHVYIKTTKSKQASGKACIKILIELLEKQRGRYSDQGFGVVLTVLFRIITKALVAE